MSARFLPAPLPITSEPKEGRGWAALLVLYGPRAASRTGRRTLFGIFQTNRQPVDNHEERSLLGHAGRDGRPADGAR